MIVYYYTGPILWNGAMYRRFFDIYKKASGQKLNRDKTSIIFSKNTKSKLKEYIASIAGVSITTNFEKHLGLTMIIAQSHMRAFSGMKGRIWEGMQRRK
jgi:hypothetical protein